VPEQEEDPYLDSADAAKLAEVPLENFRVYLKRSRKRHGEGKGLLPQHLPLPDITIGRSPAWRQSTIEDWKKNKGKRGRPPANSA
jgi:hypothetical protein